MSTTVNSSLCCLCQVGIKFFRFCCTKGNTKTFLTRSYSKGKGRERYSLGSDAMKPHPFLEEPALLCVWYKVMHSSVFKLFFLNDFSSANRLLLLPKKAFLPFKGKSFIFR